MYKFPLGEQFVICSNHATPPRLRSLEGELRTLVISAQGVDEGGRRLLAAPTHLFLQARPGGGAADGALEEVLRRLAAPVPEPGALLSGEFLPGDSLPDYRLVKFNAHGPQGDEELASFLGSSREVDLLTVRNRKTFLRKVPAYLGEAFEALKARNLAYRVLYALVDGGRPGEHQAHGRRASRHPSAHGPSRGDW